MSDDFKNKPDERADSGMQTHEAHQHKPKFSFGNIMKSTGKYSCDVCNEPITFEKPWFIANRVWYYLFLAFLIYRVLSNKATTSEAMLTNFLLIIGALLLFLIGAAAILYKGTYEIDEKAREALAAKRAETEQSETESRVYKEAAAAELTEEQAELQALYKHYERLNAEVNAAQSTEAETTGTALATAAQTAEKELACQHELVNTWKNYIPGMMEFTCAHCGTKLGFKPEVKKRINMIFMAMSLLLLIPMMNFEKVSFFAFLGMTILVLVIATVLQVFLVKRSEMIPLE